MNSVDSVEICPACGSSNINSETNLTTGICQGCGIVLGDEILSSTQSPETEIKTIFQVRSESDDTGDRPEKSTEWHSNIEVKDSSDERLVGALVQMEAAADELTMTVEARNRAAELIGEAWEQRFMHGRGENATVAACLYTACRKSGQPIPISKVADTAGVGDSKLKSIYRTMLTELSLQSEVAGPVDYIPYLSSQLGLDSKAATRAEVELGRVEGAAGNPVGIAAAALYLAASFTENTITFREAAEASGMTKETVWRKAEELRRS